MSLHFIGIRDFPVLHRQLSSPTAKSSDSPTSIQELARDSKDVLVQRLNDLSNCLLTEEALRDEDVAALHIDVDRMERAVRKLIELHQEESIQDGKSPGSIGTSRDREDDLLWRAFSPTRKVTMRLPDAHVPTSHERLQRSLEMLPERAVLLAQEAESLNGRLSNALKELRARKEESSHIHDMLITRAERAAQRITDLESRVQEIDADFEACESELSFLRLQLRALEVQGLQYIHFDADKELSESIKNWKLDWADTDQRTKLRRRKCKDLLAVLDDSQTSVDDSQ